MAYEITRLMPYRQYSEQDVINFYSLDAITGEAGSLVSVSAGNLDQQPVEYTSRGDANSYLNTVGKGVSLFPQVPYKVTKVTGTAVAVKPLGILLRDVRSVDENGENLLYSPMRKTELQCVVSGEAVPIATRGIFTINVNGLAGGISPQLNSLAIAGPNGTLTGVLPLSATAAQLSGVVGKFIATGSRSGPTNTSGGTATDLFSGSYAILKLEL
jgi:hypothetical protein